MIHFHGEFILKKSKEKLNKKETCLIGLCNNFFLILRKGVKNLLLCHFFGFHLWNCEDNIVVGAIKNVPVLLIASELLEHIWIHL